MQWFHKLRDSICDAFRLTSANKALGDQLRDLDNHVAFKDIRGLESRGLEILLEQDTQRAKDLDDKLQKLTALLSVALTVGGVVTKLIADGLPLTPLGIISLFFLFFSMLFFFIGSMISFYGLRPKPRAGIGASYIGTVAKGGDEAVLAMKRAASHFQASNAIQANYASAAIDLIRNGIVAFAIGIALSIFIKPEVIADTDQLQKAQCEARSAALPTGSRARPNFAEPKG